MRQGDNLRTTFQQDPVWKVVWNVAPPLARFFEALHHAFVFCCVGKWVKMIKMTFLGIVLTLSTYVYRMLLKTTLFFIKYKFSAYILFMICKKPLWKDT